LALFSFGFYLALKCWPVAPRLHLFSSSAVSLSCFLLSWVRWLLFELVGWGVRRYAMKNNHRSFLAGYGSFVLFVILVGSLFFLSSSGLQFSPSSLLLLDFGLSSVFILAVFLLLYAVYSSLE
jgi:hypothetical protein